MRSKAVKPSREGTGKVGSGPSLGWDEVERAAPQASQVYARLLREFSHWDEDRMVRQQGTARKLLRDLGVTYPLYREKPETDHILPFDLIPRVIEAEEWSVLSRGIAQRVKVWNAFLRDIYSDQEVLKADILPFQLVYDDPHYLRTAVGHARKEEVPIRVAAFDVARDPAGRWVVIEDHVSDLTGPSYALQARNVLTSVCPALMELAELRSIHGFAGNLLDQLQGQAISSAPEPRVVMLTSHADHFAFYEHSLLARLMGIPLVRGNDLTVLNGRVFLRTIGGLEPIDVIYRRLEEDWLDPLAFRADSAWGVPGLMSCVRKGGVVVVNSIGASLGHNNAIAAYLDRLARFYFNEPLLLPTVERHWCYDHDRLELVLSQLTRYRIRHVFERSRDQEWLPDALSAEQLDRLERKLQATPGLFIAEPLLPLSLLPVLGSNRLEKRHAGLRLFAWGGATAGDMPACALTRYAVEAGSRVISSGLGGGIKDTWVLGKEIEDGGDVPIQVYSPTRRLRLSSRIADSLYWVGRYKCRAENTTRILKVLQQLQTEDQEQQNPRQWAALWEALAHATGHATHFFKRAARFRRQTVPHYLLFDPENPSSIINAIRHCRRNAQMTRETVPPEMWFIINRVYQTLESASSDPVWAERSDLPQIQDLLSDILNQLDAMAGAAAKNMLRDDGWHFWNMGVYIERALNTVLVTRQVFMKRLDEESQSPRRDESNLDALLRMLACQYAYRSLFQARPVFHNVAALVLQDPQLPRSVLFCLLGMRDALESVFGNRFNPLDRPEELPPLRQCAQLISEIEFADLAPYFSEEPGGKPGRLRQWLEGLAEQLGDLATRISDHYLYHQNFKMLS